MEPEPITTPTFDVESYVETFSDVGLILLYIFTPPDGPEREFGLAVYGELIGRDIIWHRDPDGTIWWDIDSETREELRRLSRVHNMFEDFAEFSRPIVVEE